MCYDDLRERFCRGFFQSFLPHNFTGWVSDDKNILAGDGSSSFLGCLAWVGQLSCFV